MKKKDLRIENKLGLHARAAAQIVRTASMFSSKITFIKDMLEIDGKSIMGIMMLAAAKGTTIQVIVQGDDEEKAIREIEKLFLEKFGEKE
ncbi:MAG: HPr family phosphocarrier protein [Nitrospirota bacterium]